LGAITDIARRYGDGSVHLITRQGLEILGIRFEDIPEVKAVLQPVISGLAFNHETPGAGYGASGTRNIAACIGNRVCPYACYDTTALVQRIERAVFPHDLHVKIALTGCPNDCARVRLHDFDSMGMTEPRYKAEHCISCRDCIKACQKKSARALREISFRPNRDESRCIGCGEGVLAYPMAAWQRSLEQWYQLTLFGKTGKRNPRLAVDFIRWIDADSIITIILNTYRYVEQYIDPHAPGGKEHIGYIVDRTGFEEYKYWALQGVTLPPKAEVSEPGY
jgi:anaerobic sulfite reductase subunit C